MIFIYFVCIKSVIFNAVLPILKYTIWMIELIYE